MQLVARIVNVTLAQYYSLDMRTRLDGLVTVTTGTHAFIVFIYIDETTGDSQG